MIVVFCSVTSLLNPKSLFKASTFATSRARLRVNGRVSTADDEQKQLV